MSQISKEQSLAVIETAKLMCGDVRNFGPSIAQMSSLVHRFPIDKESVAAVQRDLVAEMLSRPGLTTDVTEANAPAAGIAISGGLDVLARLLDAD